MAHTQIQLEVLCNLYLAIFVLWYEVGLKIPKKLLEFHDDFTHLAF